jgi:hypothetical protein
METPTDSSTGAIIKSDRTGRTRYTAQYKREVLDAFDSSSLGAPAFAMQCGVKYPTFAAWISGRRQSSPPRSTQQRSDATQLNARHTVLKRTKRDQREKNQKENAIHSVLDSRFLICFPPSRHRLLSDEIQRLEGTLAP